MMQGSIPEDKIDEIKRRINIVDLVAGYVNLKQAGRNFIGLCPFHQEKTPSFTVSPEKQIFYCFGCGEGGNAVTFIMKQNGLSFPEAIRYLARKTGVALPTRPLSNKEKGELSLREKMLRLHGLAAAFFFRAPGGARRSRGPAIPAGAGHKCGGRKGISPGLFPAGLASPKGLSGAEADAP